MGKPDVLLAEIGIRTTVRRLLESEFLEMVEDLRREFSEQMGVHWSHAEVKAAEAALLRARLTSDRRSVGEARAVGKVLPRAESLSHGEDQARAELQRRRRARLEGRATAEARSARSSLGEKLRQVELDRIVSLAEVDRLQGMFFAEVDHAKTMLMTANAVYEDALLRRHPQGDLLRVLLDATEFALPEWISDWAEDGDQKRGTPMTQDADTSTEA